MKKTSCCCGATKDKPCACMKKGVMECSSKEPKCPCYKAKDLKKSFDAGWSVVKGETCNHMRVGKEPCIACGGNRESNTKDPAKEVIKMNPRLPKEGALDGVLSRNPDPPAMNAGMPRDPDLLARLKRMHEAKMRAKEEKENPVDFDPETAKYGINNLE